jgi:hypothetical protein
MQVSRYADVGHKLAPRTTAGRTHNIRKGKFRAAFRSARFSLGFSSSRNAAVRPSVDYHYLSNKKCYQFEL